MFKAMEVESLVPVQHNAVRHKTSNGLPADAQLNIVTTTRSLETLAADWRALEQTCHVPPTIFQSYDWVKAWVDVHLTGETTDQLFIVTGHRASRLVFVMPLLLTKKFGLRKLSWLTQPIGQYGDLLCDQSVDLNEWTNAAQHLIRNNKVADCLRLRHVRATSNVGPHAKANWFDGKLNERAPAMDLTRFATEADYDARYDAEQRRRRRRIRAKLEKIGPVSFEVLPPEAAQENIKLALEEKVKWLTERGRYNSALHCPKHVQFLQSLANLKSTSMKQITTRLSAGDKPISWEVGFLYQGTQYQYLTAHMAHLTDLSPGRLSFDLAQRLALRDGVKKFDLMIPYDQHKESWASGSEPVTDYHLPLTLRGAIYAHFYLGLVRPVMRKVYLRTPQSILKKLQSVLCY